MFYVIYKFKRVIFLFRKNQERSVVVVVFFETKDKYLFDFSTN